MKALIFAAGRGVRMLPLTLHTPKPLLQVHGKPLIVMQIEALVRAGIGELVINLSYLGAQIRAALGDGRAFGAQIQYSEEGLAPLETAGGIRYALHLLGPGPFLAVSSDILVDFDFSRLLTARPTLAHLVMVANPPHHPEGDFSLSHGLCGHEERPKYTFSGIGWYRPELFAGLPAGALKLVDVLRPAIAAGQVSGELHTGRWIDVGTPERLSELNR